MYRNYANAYNILSKIIVLLCAEFDLQYEQVNAAAVRASLIQSATARRHGSNVSNLDKIIQELQAKVAKSQVYINISNLV